MNPPNLKKRKVSDLEIARYFYAGYSVYQTAERFDMICLEVEAAIRRALRRKKT